MSRKFDPRPGKGANHDRKITLMRAAKTAVTYQFNSGGGKKFGAYRSKPVSLPSLSSAERLGGDDGYAERARRYRNKAEEFRTLADCARSEDTRTAYLGMAANYEATAEQMDKLARLAGGSGKEEAG